MHLRTLLSLIACVSIAFPAAGAEWRQIAPGIEYIEDTLPGPAQVYVARADRQQKTWTIDAMMANGSAKGARETVPDMVARCDDTVNFRGEQLDAKIAINGSYFNPKTGVPFGGEIVGGWFVRRWDEYSGGSGFFWTIDRHPVLGGNIHNGPKFQQAIFADGTTLNIDKLNDPRGKNELALYTWQYADKTDATEPGIEVVVRMSGPTWIMPDDGGVPGEIVGVRETTGDTTLLYDHVILSGHGKAADALRKSAKVGQQVKINLTLKDFGNKDIGQDEADWRGAYASIPTAQYILIKGNVPRHWEKKAAKYAAEGKTHGSVVKAPRTLIAYNDRYVFFAVVDGRWARSPGMTFTEAGEFCRDYLKADYAVNQDGGGSSTMWVEGEVRNHVSDFRTDDKPGELRPVANGYFIASVSPAKRSDAFKAGAAVTTAGAAELRRGPGPHFGVTASLPAQTRGRLLTHNLSGVQIKGEYWWNCRFGPNEGWLPQKSLAKP